MCRTGAIWELYVLPAQFFKFLQTYNCSKKIKSTKIHVIKCYINATKKFYQDLVNLWKEELRRVHDGKINLGRETFEGHLIGTSVLDDSYPPSF